jgi:urease subunit alpha
VYGAHWGGQGVAPASLSVNFVSAAAAAGDFRRQVPSRRRALAVAGTRQVGKRHMLYNQANPRIAIDPRTAEIRIEGEPLPPLPDDDLPLNRRYFLF